MIKNQGRLQCALCVSISTYLGESDKRYGIRALNPEEELEHKMPQARLNESKHSQRRKIPIDLGDVRADSGYLLGGPSVASSVHICELVSSVK